MSNRIAVAAIFMGLLASCATGGEVSPAAQTEWPALKPSFATLEELNQVSAQFPNSMGMQRRRLGAAITAKDKATALDAARLLAAAGAGLSAGARKQLEALVGAEAMVSLAAVFDANNAPLNNSSVFTTIPANYHLLEGLIWDSRAKRLYATTVVDRALLLVQPGSGISIAASADFGSLFGGAFDPERNRIWTASAIIEQTPKTNTLFSGLLSIDARTLEPTRIDVPEGATLGDVAIARDGTVYASDGLKGGVYRCLPGCERAEQFLPAGSLFSAQGVVVSPDQKRLYIADRRYGIAVVDRATGKIAQLSGAQDMMLDGIDGLIPYGGDLIATQTAYAPQRIIRLRLSRDGYRVERLDILERANPEWGEITLGAIVGDRLLYVADGQWGRYGEGGVPAADHPEKSTPIRSLPLR